MIIYSCTLLTLLLVCSSDATTQLVVNVKHLSNEVFQETIAANNTDDWVSIEYLQPDSTYVSHVLDFKQELQVVHVVKLGEEERGQKPFQELCFVTKLGKEDYISSDAMSKLRQKNPWTVRVPEEDKGVELLDADLSLDVSAMGGLLSRYIVDLCSSAPTMTFASSRDLKAWIHDRQDVDSDWAAVSDASHQLPIKGVAPCQDSTALQQPCVCQQQVCLWWYPCGLKFCKDRDDSGKPVSYRCGIKTCKKCRLYAYYTSSKVNCIR